MKKIVYFLAVLLFSQCKTGTNPSGTLVEIDISRKYPEKDMYLQDIAKVEYIPLETNRNTLMQSGAQIEYKLMNKDFETSNISFAQAITPDNTGVCLLDVALLFGEDESGKIKGELEQLLHSLDEEDNPVLMKIEF
jgi:hypothetical protein